MNGNRRGNRGAKRPFRLPEGLPPLPRTEAREGTEATDATLPTSAIKILPSRHGKERRQQRNIGRRQLQAAMKYGRRTNGGLRGRSKYSYDGITFVVDDATGREITSFATPVDLPYKTVSKTERLAHQEAHRKILNDDSYCKSHSVLIVDISGSMRNSDVHGARTRLGAVWLAIAEDFIRNRIESGVASEIDAISVVLMGQRATVLANLSSVPTSWCTYNAVLRILKEGIVIPRGHGCYKPALAKADEILMRYQAHDCQLVLAIMSDGRPSDSAVSKTSVCTQNEEIRGAIENLASKLGSRLLVSSVGMGSANQFEVLREVTEAAKSYGSEGALQLPSMSSSSLGAAMSTIATTLTATQLASANDGRRIRSVIRENRNTLPVLTEVVDNQDFDIYMGDRVTHKAYFDDEFVFVNLRHPEAKGVAIRKKPFGEGTERYAYQFFEVAVDGETVVGDPLVAKESRFFLDGTRKANDAISFEEGEKFQRRFCRIEHQATKCAVEFNRKLDEIRSLDSDTPRVCFLHCTVYHLHQENGEKIPVMVEPRLFGKFHKWNTNNGWIKQEGDHKTRPARPDKAKSFSLPAIAEDDETTKMVAKPEAIGSNRTAGEAPKQPEIIVIDSDEEEEKKEGDGEKIFVTANEVAQAFSHFSYIHLGRKGLVCDLQGVYDRREKLMQFTDPVVHYFDVFKEHKQNVYGRTDQGETGIRKFLNTHECNALCDLVCKGFFVAKTPTKERSAKRQKRYP